ncbi:Na/Pi cotransporter family protein [Algivirga pacifica]|uniref:Na/Pi cotransporter family protein n=1 Tax=Algivirga pacifica TaxID=1162670 RepID=A0ABP9DAP5_9BACT
MDYSFLNFLNFLGALGLVIYGMRTMNEGLKNVTEDKIREVVSTMASTPIIGVFIGFLVTAFIQSSSVTTVMAVGFTNASLLSLQQGISIVLGANIGTTVTAWMISILGFQVNISKLAMGLLVIAVPMYLSQKSQFKSWGEVLAGFSLFFLGIAAMQDSVPALSLAQVSFLQDLTHYGIWSIMLFVLVGFLITIVMQSSSAAMAFTLVLCSEGMIPFDVAAAMVIGENIGTTITANLAALVSNTNAKRVARAHFIINFLGSIWAVAVLPWMLDGIDYIMLNYTDYGMPEVNNPLAITVGLSLFHSLFNIVNVFVMLNFNTLLEAFASQLVPQRVQDLEDTSEELVYVNTSQIYTLDAAITDVKKEYDLMAKDIKAATEACRDMLLLSEEHKQERDRAMQFVRKVELKFDKREVELFDYLIKVADKSSLSEVAAIEIRSLIRILHDLERITDVFKSMSYVVEKRYGGHVWLLEDQQKEIAEYFDIVQEALDLMIVNMNKGYGRVRMDDALDLEKKINNCRRSLRKKNMKRISKVSDGGALLAYNDLISSIERIGDHILGVSKAVAGLVD